MARRERRNQERYRHRRLTSGSIGKRTFSESHGSEFEEEETPEDEDILRFSDRRLPLSDQT